MLILSTIRTIIEFAQWWCRIYPLKQIHQARKELRKLEDEKEKLDNDPTPGNFLKSKRLLSDIKEAHEYFEYLSNAHAKASPKHDDTNS